MIPGRELDALVAEKVMGWTLGKEYWLLNLAVYPFVSKALEYPKRWSPSTNISDAWEVVEKLKQDSANNMIEIFWDYDAWYVNIHNYIKQDIVMAVDSNTEVESAPHAICLAALKAVGVEL